MECEFLLLAVAVLAARLAAALQAAGNTIQDKCGVASCNEIKKGMVNIHIVPHSHDDVGWVKTVDQYYYGLNQSIDIANVSEILDTVFQQLIKDPKKRYVQVETAYLWMWWQHQSDEVKEKYRQLVQSGRVQITGGGWTMPDEAITSHQALIDNFSWGFRFLNDTFGPCGIPDVGWQIDSFGHSREMASIMAAMGFQGVFLGRLDYQDYGQRLGDSTLEFLWHGSDNLGQQADIFASVLYDGYGPPSGCCWDLRCGDGDIGKNFNLVTNNFIARMNSKLKHFKTRNLMVTMGNDFTYMDANRYYRNIDEIIGLVNERQSNGSHMNLLYSTPTCYLQAVNEAQQLNLTTKSDDFLPYTLEVYSVWAGYYSSRPNLKYFERLGNNFLQVSKQLTSLARIGDAYLEPLNAVRRAMATLQHHDAISGTTRQHVAQDYAKSLAAAIDGCEQLVQTAISTLLAPNKTGKLATMKSCLLLNISECDVSEKSDSFIVTVYNPLSRVVSHYVRLPVKGGSYSVTSSDGKQSDSFIVTVYNPLTRVVSHYVRLPVKGGSYSVASSDGKQSDSFIVTVYNPLTRVVSHYVRLPVRGGSYSVTSSDGKQSDSFIVTVYNPLTRVVSHYVRLPVKGGSYSVISSDGKQSDSFIVTVYNPLTRVVSHYVRLPVRGGSYSITSSDGKQSDSFIVTVYNPLSRVVSHYVRLPVRGGSYSVTSSDGKQSDRFIVTVYNPLSRVVSHYVRLPVRGGSYSVTSSDGKQSDSFIVTVYNPLTRVVSHYVRLPVRGGSYSVTSSDGKQSDSFIVTVYNPLSRVVSHYVRLPVRGGSYSVTSSDGKQSDSFIVTVYNPLTRVVSHYVRLPVRGGSYSVTSSDGKQSDSFIVTVYNPLTRVVSHYVRLPVRGGSYSITSSDGKQSDSFIVTVYNPLSRVVSHYVRLPVRGGSYSVTSSDGKQSDRFIVTVYNPLSRVVSHYVRLPVRGGSYSVTSSDGKQSDSFIVTVYNPLTRVVSHYVRLPVRGGSYSVTSSDGKQSDSFIVTVYNPLSRVVSHYVRLPVRGGSYSVTSSDGKQSDSFIVTVYNPLTRVVSHYVRLPVRGGSYSVTSSDGKQSDSFIVTVYNPLTRVVSHYVRLPVRGGSYSVTSSDGKQSGSFIVTAYNSPTRVVSHYLLLPIGRGRPSVICSGGAPQIVQMIPIPSPVLDLKIRKSTAKQELIFRAADLPPLGMRVYTVSRTSSVARQKRSIQVEDTVIGNSHVTVKIDSVTGLLDYIITNGTTISARQNFYYYESRWDDGAYAFKPRTPAPIKVEQRATFTVYKGELVEEIHQIFNDWVSQVIRVYKDDSHVEFQWLVGTIQVAVSGKQIISKFLTNVQSNQTYYTDSNGREMQKRVRNYRETFLMELDEPVSSNYFPVSSRILVKDDAGLEFAVLTDRPQGAGSLAHGQLELMVHRRMQTDDFFGLNEVMNDTQPARGTHFVVCGDESGSGGLTLAARQRQLAQKILLRPWIFLGPSSEWPEAYEHQFSGLQKALPDNVHVLTLEPWGENRLLLRLEHIMEKNDDPQLSQNVTVNLEELFSSLTVSSFRETTLDGNRWLSDVKRFTWQTTQGSINPNIQPSTHGPLVTLSPMQIKTFILTIKHS